MHRLGMHKGEEWGCSPEQIKEWTEQGEKCHSEPHPLFLEGRSPHYRICGTPACHGCALS